MSDDRKPWIAVRLLLHVMIDQVCLFVCFIQGVSAAKQCRSMSICIQLMEKANAEKKKGGTTEESGTGCY